jgi:V-type H+-transporting ATPase subunit B
MADTLDPRMTSVQPRIRYNTIGGINGPLVFLDNVRVSFPEAVFFLQLSREIAPCSQA